MKKMNRIISTAVLVCFLINTAVSDLAFAQTLNLNSDKLAAALRLDDITGPQIGRMAKVKFALETYLIDKIGNSQKSIDEYVLRRCIGRALLKAETKYQPEFAGMNFFFAQMPSAVHMPDNTETRLCIRCDVQDKDGKERFYAVFSLTRDEKGGFPVYVYTRNEAENTYKDLRKLATERPERNPDVAKAFDGYIKHEKYDRVIKWVHDDEMIPVYSSDELGINYSEMVKDIIKTARLEIDNGGLTPLEARECYIVPITPRIRIRLEDNKVTIHTRDGSTKDIIAYFHLSNFGQTIFLEAGDVNLLMAHGTPRQDLRMINIIKEKIKDKVAHEAGKGLGLAVLKFEGDTPINEVDVRYRVGALEKANNQEPSLSVKKYALQDLDHLMWKDAETGETVHRDYAFGGGIMRNEGAPTALFQDKDELLAAVTDAVRFDENYNVQEIANVEFLRKLTPQLYYNYTYSSNTEIKAITRNIARQGAKLLGTEPASLANIYEAQSKEEVRFTLPSINIRLLTFDSARAILAAARELNAGAFQIELARSERGYTGIDYEQLVTTSIFAAIAVGFQAPLHFKLDHSSITEKDLKEDLNTVLKLQEEAIGAGVYNIDIDASALEGLKDSSLPEGSPNIQANITATVRAALSARIYGWKVAPHTIITLGGEAGGVGTKENTTPEVMERFISGVNEKLKQATEQWIKENPEEYQALLTARGTTRLDPREYRLNVASGQNVTAHGGLFDAKTGDRLTKIDIDFGLIQNNAAVIRKHGAAGYEQHGASTVPVGYYGKFVKYGTAEVHLATAYMESAMDFNLKHPEAFTALSPEEQKVYVDTREKFMTSYYASPNYKKTLDRHAVSVKKAIEDDKSGELAKYFPDEQSILDEAKRRAETDAERRRIMGPYKQIWDDLPQAVKGAIAEALRAQFIEIFKALEVANTLELARQPLPFTPSEEMSTVIRQNTSSFTAPVARKGVRELGMADVIEAQHRTAAMKEMAPDLGQRIWQRSEKYNFIVPAQFYKNDDLKNDTSAYRNRFNFECFSGTTSPDAMVKDILDKVRPGEEANTVVLLPVTKDFTADHVRKLMEMAKRVRFMPINLTEFDYIKGGDEDTRDRFRGHTYGGMLLFRQADENMDSLIYVGISAYLNMHFSFDGKITGDEYIDAIKKGDIALLIKGHLSYKRFEIYDAVKDHREISHTLIFA